MCRRQQDVHRNLDLIGGNCSPSVMCEKSESRKKWKWKKWKLSVLKKCAGDSRIFHRNLDLIGGNASSAVQVLGVSCPFLIPNSWIFTKILCLCRRRIYWNIYFQLISNSSTFRMWLKLPRCKSCCLPQGGGCNSYNLLFPPSLSSSLPPPFSSFSSLLLFLSSYSPARLSSSGRELWIFRRSSCKCFTMSGDWWWCAPNFFLQERCDLDSFIFAFARIHFPQCDWWLTEYYLFTWPCHWLCDQILAFDLQNMHNCTPCWRP